MVHRSRWKRPFAGVLTLLVIGLVFLASHRRESHLQPSLLDGSTRRIVPGIHLLGNLGPAVAYAVETREGLILIDAGLDSDAERLKSELAKSGLDWKRLRAILLTHVHCDHCGGAQQLRSATGATVYAGQFDAPFLRSGQPREALVSVYNMPGYTPHPTTIDVSLAGDERLTFGDVSFQILATPGHTPGSTCYLMQRTGLRVLFSGDVIMRLGQYPFGTYSAYLSPRYLGDAEAYLASLRMLGGMPVPDLVLPGHPPIGPPQSPRLTDRRWEALLASGISEMEQLVSRYEADGRDFLDDHAKRLLPDLYYLGDYGHSAVFGFFVEAKFFVIDAPGGPGLTDFLKKRLSELGLRPAGPTAVLLTACGERETAGLNDLIEHSHAQVVVGHAAIEDVKRLCPLGTIVIPAAELPKQGWFPVTPIALHGPGAAPVAYLLKWTGKKVLFSGRIPVIADEKSPVEQYAGFIKTRKNAEDYVASLRQLFDANPDLWLPIVPSKEQNANLYDSWNDILASNLRAVNHMLRTSQSEAESDSK